MSKIMPLDRDALRQACREVVRHTLWQTPSPQNIDDIVDTDQIVNLAGGYFEEALVHLEYVEEQGRDPNLIVRAVAYLAQGHAIPPMREDLSWFRNRLEALIELAVPNSGYTADSIAFFADVREGLAEAEQHVNET